MSVIHEALKRAREARQQKGGGPASGPVSPTVTLKSTRQSGAWLWWLMLFFVLAEGALYFRERALRQRAEQKLQTALLELNDSRGETMDLQKKYTDLQAHVDELNGRLEEEIRDKADLASAKQSVEFDNVEKEKKISLLTNALHDSEMGKFQLEDEVRSLKAELANASSLPPVATETPPNVPADPVPAAS